MRIRRSLLLFMKNCALTSLAKDLFNAISNCIVMKIRDSKDALGGVYRMESQDLEFRFATKMNRSEETYR